MPGSGTGSCCLPRRSRDVTPACGRARRAVRRTTPCRGGRVSSGTRRCCSARSNWPEPKAFYLVFDPAKPDLALMLRGAELQRYPVLGAQVGRPRVVVVRPAAAIGLAGRGLDERHPRAAAADRSPRRAGRRTREGRDRNQGAADSAHGRRTLSGAVAVSHPVRRRPVGRDPSAGSRRQPRALGARAGLDERPKRATSAPRSGRASATRSGCGLCSTRKTPSRSIVRCRPTCGSSSCEDRRRPGPSGPGTSA